MFSVAKSSGIGRTNCDRNLEAQGVEWPATTSWDTNRKGAGSGLRSEVSLGAQQLDTAPYMLGAQRSGEDPLKL
jgi:hypothetical protein